jgi:hypothetical protein
MIVPAQERSLSSRAWWAIIVASISAVVVLVAVLGVIVTHRSHPETASIPTTTADAAMQQWWSVAQEHFDALQSAVDDTAISGSLNSYAGEFDADLEQADKHLQAALELINKGRLTA